MKNSLQIDITFDQILAYIKQLSKKDKLRISRELEQDGIHSKFTKLLNTFKTSNLSQKTIDAEVEEVRREIYGKAKH
ncbi:MAG: type II toxin-antitoxin system VapB15 family antitoxin [Bacteroidia bacterium]|jgi:hypothetical protein